MEFMLSSGESREKRDPTEWLDLKSRVEEEKFRKLSADLERRRTRRFHQHEEEERKVVQELNNLQRDRLRFEREKQLRQRNSFSSSRERRQSMRLEKKLLSEVSTKLPMNEKSFGASASLAFDPTIAKSSRPQRRASKEQLTNYGSTRKASKDLSDSSGFPYIDEDDVRHFHKLCKSASKSECRRWGAAWFYAKKEQDVANDAKKRWTSLLLKSEKEKMRVLSAKGVAFLDFQSNLPSGDNETIGRKVSSGKENKSSFDGPKNSSSCRDQEKGSVGNFRESVELSKEKKLTFHKAFSSCPRECAELVRNEKLTFHKAFSLPQEKKESRVSRENEELVKDGKLIFHKSSCQRHPSAEDLSKDGEKNGESTPVDCKNITALFKERGQERKLKRSKKRRICAGEMEDFKENALPRMPVIHELDAEESSSASSDEKSKNVLRRKRAVCFLPNLKND